MVKHGVDVGKDSTFFEAPNLKCFKNKRIQFSKDFKIEMYYVSQKYLFKFLFLGIDLKQTIKCQRNMRYFATTMIQRQYCIDSIKVDTFRRKETGI